MSIKLQQSLTDSTRVSSTEERAPVLSSNTTRCKLITICVVAKKIAQRLHSRSVVELQ
jgi:hypothetical protein